MGAQMSRRGALLAGAAALASRGARAEAATLKIGHIVPLSGVFKSIAEPSAAAADIAAAQLNAAGGIGGMKIELVRYDTGSDPAQASVAARKLIEDDGVLAIVGPFSSGEASVAAGNAERNHITMIPTAASRPGLADGRKYLWPLATDEKISFSHVLMALDAKGEKPKVARIVYVSDEAVGADAGNKTYPAVLAAAGVEYGTPVGVQYKAFNFAPQIAKVLQAHPDVVAVAGVPDMASKVLHELRRQDFKGRMIGSNLFADPNNVGLFGAEGDGTIFSSLFWKKSSPAAEAFNAAFLEENTKRGIHKLAAFHTDAITYDSVRILAQAMTLAGVTGQAAKLAAEREAINAAMPRIHYDGALGAGICFHGQYGSLPGYVIELRQQEWALFQSFPAIAC